MSFKKDGEVKVFKADKKVSPKFSKKDKAKRYTVDDLVKDADKALQPKEIVVVVETEDSEEE